MGTLFDVVAILSCGMGSSGSFEELVEFRLLWIMNTATATLIVRIIPTIPPMTIQTRFDFPTNGTPRGVSGVEVVRSIFSRNRKARKN